MKSGTLYRLMALGISMLLTPSLSAHPGHLQSVAFHPHPGEWVLLLIAGIVLSVLTMKTLARVIRTRKDR